ncbi:hypothetical protein [Mycolicibacterium grossiae]|uniref:Uncharacterized protein n=2 Tax=Mycolicibacterium grossiae TaxID=1552759 RepID=A0A1E8Q1H0_9MYCO|nr:hypothetical protein [Mycolicibacterium grossiae]OFJ52206.1 hypothetical protein BEL07_18700 [Mycolicibacterium grossiae]QEM46669.1 hypothetical protein FZ046_19540 [Mycolicibacterium grossiae]
MPGPTMSRHDSRTRAAEAFALRSAHWSWREIMRKLDYRSVGAAQSAVKAHVAREHREPAEVTHREQVESVRLRSRVLGERFAAAFLDADDDKLAALNRELVRNGDQLAKLTGTYQPERQQVDVTVGRSPAEILAEGKSQLLAVLAQRGDANALPSAGRHPYMNGDNALDAIDAEVVER